MSQLQLLRYVINALDSLDIPYMLTGAFVSSMQGVPRMTHDIDIVVVLQESKLEDLQRFFSEPDYYLDEGSLREAIKRKSCFNLIDQQEGSKVVFWLLTDEPFDRSRFERRRIEDALGMKLSVSSPEDTILQKLRWAELSGGSEKQMADALSVFEVQWDRLDRSYMEDWAERLGVRSRLLLILAQLGE